MWTVINYNFRLSQNNNFFFFTNTVKPLSALAELTNSYVFSGHKIRQNYVLLTKQTIFTKKKKKTKQTISFCFVFL